MRLVWWWWVGHRPEQRPFDRSACVVSMLNTEARRGRGGLREGRAATAYGGRARLCARLSCQRRMPWLETRSMPRRLPVGCSALLASLEGQG